MRYARGKTVVRLTVALVCLAASAGALEAGRLLSFVSARQGWMVGFGPNVYCTEDGGRTWLKQSTPAGGELRAIYFVDAHNGWAVGDGGAIVRTGDGGKQWRLCARETEADLLDVFFLDADHGWAVGRQATVVRTTNGGKRWRRCPLKLPLGSLTGVAFAHYSDGKPRYGLVVSAGGGILRTRDGGRKWLLKLESANPLHSVVAVNPYTGVDRVFDFAAGSGGTFFDCYDHNYEMTMLRGQPNLTALDFLNDKTGWVVGQAGCVRKTTDGGKTWAVQDVRPLNLQAVACIDPKRAWALGEPVGAGGDDSIRRILLITANGGQTWDDVTVPAAGASGQGAPAGRAAVVDDSPCVVFVPTGHPISNRFILPDRRIRPGEIRKDVTIAACRGEYEPATFAIRSSVPLKNVTVKAGDLRVEGEPGKIIPAGAVDVRWVKCWRQARFGQTPELLLKNDALVPSGADGTQWAQKISTLADSEDLRPVNLPARHTKQVWLTVRVPDAAEPGGYAGTISVTAEGHRPRTLVLHLTVLPFALAAPTLDYGLYVNSEIPAEGLAGRLWPRTPKQVRSLLENLRAHGVTHPYVHQPITLKPKSRDPNDPKGRGTGGVAWREVKYDPTNLRLYLKMMGELGFPRDKLFWGNSYMLVRICYSKRQKVGDPKLPKWPLEAIMPTVHIVTREAKEAGFGEVYFYGMDEVSRQQLEFQRPLFKMMRNAGTPVPAKAFSASGHLTDVYDATTCSLLPSPSEIKKYQAAGRRAYLYANPVSGVEQPYTFRRNVGLLLYKFGVNGTGWWSDYAVFSRHDFSFVYYTRDGQIDTLQWEGWREGVDDVRYLTTLHQAIENLKKVDDPAAGPAVQTAEAWLAKLKITDDPQQVRREAIAHIMALSGR